MATCHHSHSQISWRHSGYDIIYISIYKRRATWWKFIVVTKGELCDENLSSSQKNIFLWQGLFVVIKCPSLVIIFIVVTKFWSQNPNFFVLYYEIKYRIIWVHNYQNNTYYPWANRVSWSTIWMVCKTTMVKIFSKYYDFSSPRYVFSGHNTCNVIAICYMKDISTTNT